MIWLHFQIDNPFSERWQVLKAWSGRLTKNKCWELNWYATHQLVELQSHLTFTGDHAGFLLLIGLFHRTIEFQIYDRRHWDYFKNDWESDADHKTTAQPVE
jgi:hypothetical protein